VRRIPEPEELMADPGQALAYAEADFSESNGLFLELFRRLHAAPFAGRALDLGCGPGDIPIRLARAFPAVRVDAVDGAEAMLDLARGAVAGDADLAARIRWICARIPSAEAMPAAPYDAVLSNSLLHHLADPLDLWRAVRDAGRPGAAVLVMDLARPADVEGVERVLAAHAAGAPEVLWNDFRNSLFAAYTVDEVRAQLAAAGIAGFSVEMVSDRHLAVRGLRSE
jgi:SAM-dependent methyltransferase